MKYATYNMPAVHATCAFMLNIIYAYMPTCYIYAYMGHATYMLLYAYMLNICLQAKYAYMLNIIYAYMTTICLHAKYMPTC